MGRNSNADKKADYALKDTLKKWIKMQLTVHIVVTWGQIILSFFLSLWRRYRKIHTKKIKSHFFLKKIFLEMKDYAIAVTLKNYSSFIKFL